jgi:hypothetical protein
VSYPDTVREHTCILSIDIPEGYYIDGQMSMDVEVGSWDNPGLSQAAFSATYELDLNVVTNPLSLVGPYANEQKYPGKWAYLIHLCPLPEEDRVTFTDRARQRDMFPLWGDPFILNKMDSTGHFTFVGNPRLTAESAWVVAGTALGRQRELAWTDNLVRHIHHYWFKSKLSSPLPFAKYFNHHRGGTMRFALQYTRYRSNPTEYGETTLTGDEQFEEQDDLPGKYDFCIGSNIKFLLTQGVSNHHAHVSNKHFGHVGIIAGEGSNRKNTVNSIGLIRNDIEASSGDGTDLKIGDEVVHNGLVDISRIIVEPHLASLSIGYDDSIEKTDENNADGKFDRWSTLDEPPVDKVIAASTSSDSIRAYLISEGIDSLATSRSQANKLSPIRGEGLSGEETSQGVMYDEVLYSGPNSLRLYLPTNGEWVTSDVITDRAYGGKCGLCTNGAMWFCFYTTVGVRVDELDRSWIVNVEPKAEHSGQPDFEYSGLVLAISDNPLVWTDAIHLHLDLYTDTGLMEYDGVSPYLPKLESFYKANPALDIVAIEAGYREQAGLPEDGSFVTTHPMYNEMSLDGGVVEKPYRQLYDVSDDIKRTNNPYLLLPLAAHYNKQRSRLVLAVQSFYYPEFYSDGVRKNVGLYSSPDYGMHWNLLPSQAMKDFTYLLNVPE